MLSLLFLSIKEGLAQMLIPLHRLFGGSIGVGVKMVTAADHQSSFLVLLSAAVAAVFAQRETREPADFNALAD